MNLQKLKDAAALINAFIAEAEGKPEAPVFERKPLPDNVEMAYVACKPLWEAAQKAGLFNVFDYIPGLQQGGVIRKPPKSGEEMNADIIKLGFTAWGQDWLSHDENASQLHPAYQRHFLGYVAVRKAQNDSTQGYNRVP